MKALIASIAVCLAIGSSGAIAQGHSGESAPSGAKAAASDKQAISKSCSEQANAKGLRGKARRQFRSACKRAGGKSS